MVEGARKCSKLLVVIYERPLLQKKIKQSVVTPRVPLYLDYLDKRWIGWMRLAPVEHQISVQGLESLLSR